MSYIAAMSNDPRVTAQGTLPVLTPQFSLLKAMLLSSREWCGRKRTKLPEWAVPIGMSQSRKCFCFPRDALMPRGCPHEEASLGDTPGPSRLDPVYCEHCSICIRCNKTFSCESESYDTDVCDVLCVCCFWCFLFVCPGNLAKKPVLRNVSWWHKKKKTSVNASHLVCIGQTCGNTKAWTLVWICTAVQFLKCNCWSMVGCASVPWLPVPGPSLE